MNDENVSGESKSATEEASDRFGKAREFVGDQYAAASGAVRDGYKAAREKVDEIDFNGLTEQVRSYVRSHPGKALILSIGTGFVLGLLLRRNDDNED